MVVLTLGAIWAKPERLLNENNVRRAASRFLPGWKVSWAEFHWSFGQKGWLEKTTDLRVRELCVRSDTGNLDTCLPELGIALGFSIAGLKPRITELSELVAQARHFRLRMAKTPEDSPASPLPDLRLPRLSDFLPEKESLALLRRLEVSAEQLEIGTAGEEPLRGRLSLKKEGKTIGLEARLKKARNLSLAVKAGVRLEENEAAVEGSISGLASGWRVRSPLSARWGERLSLSLRPELSRKGKAYSGTFELKATPAELFLTASKLKAPVYWRTHQLQTNNCTLRASLHEKEGYPERSELHCSLQLRAGSAGALVKEASISLRAEIALGRTGSNIHSDLDFEAGSTQELFRASAKGGGRLNFDRQWRFAGVSRPRLLADASVPRFSRLQGLLAGSPWAVPAPFHVLDGEIALHARLEESSGDLLPVRVELRTALRGGQQSLATSTSALVKARGLFHGKASFEIEADARLSDIALEAPPLRLESPPQATLDKRFQRGAADKKAPGRSNVRWRLRVSNEKPVRIRTNLLPEPLPFAVELALAHDHRPSGTVTLLPVPVEVFKKRAQVEKITFTLRKSSDTAELDGLLTYRNPEALVRILLLGAAREPRVVLQSDPPLSESQIVSLLLFNKSVQELTEEEASSSASMGQALSDGAFGLFTLMFLSSTPVESVGYDPVSDTYSVRVRMDDKTTVSVASDFQGERQYAIRRRIGKRWAVSSELQRNEEEGASSLLTLLEWFNRF